MSYNKLEDRVVLATAMGPCLITWTPAGLTGVRLLDPSARGQAAPTPEAARKLPLPAWVADLERGLADHLAGRASASFDRVPLDLSGITPFHRRVYEALRRVPAGETVTYGQLAALAGSPRAARAVGQAMAHNPFLLVVPCHRVLGHGGAMGGFSAPGGVDTKRRMLELEGAGD
jgi:methylated-DNA-[protein]-cysteine S-methyltransferase